ncbi:hypothetical protein DSO57_1008764 [Entomophthora muscae]|uniref:Uncharacterized protein n=1 Tax=Entomophthora muscae TaxID=34485 RepID=A0ACC2UHL2_9FUNG|nr:hypothetical protein DSO57_1008764 [Entomophthora muscae]
MFGDKFSMPSKVEGLPKPIRAAFLQEIRDNTKQAIVKCADQMKKQHNKGLKIFEEFKIGQPKFIAKWSRPFIVVEVLPNHNYCLADMDRIAIPSSVNNSCLKVFERLI